MDLFKNICIAVVFVILTSSFSMPWLPESTCDDMNISAAIHPTDKKDVFTVNVTIEGGQSPFKYIFSMESGNLASTDFDSNAVSGLKKGKYFCTVIDRSNCKKTIEIVVQ